jgi:hypothetical protein
VENHWFYIKNDAPQLPEKSNSPPVVRPEWNIEHSRGDMDQIEELLDTIAAHKLMGVIGASVMFSFFKRRVQPIQQRHRLGFEYTGAERFVSHVRRGTVRRSRAPPSQAGAVRHGCSPLRPTAIRVTESFEPVSIRLLLLKMNSVLPLLTKNLL